MSILKLHLNIHRMSKGIIATYILMQTEIEIFENFIFGKRCSFYHPAELFPSFSQLGEEKKHLFPIIIYLPIIFRNLVYLETLLFGCCINTIFVHE